MAGGEKLVREISDQFLNCKICFESFKNPKTLTCLHTFCTDCLQQHVDSESTRSRFSIYNRYVTCPICRKKTDIPTGGIRRLPDNFLLCNLTEIIDRRRPSKIPPCEICHTVRPRSNDACAKCLDCSKLLCKACVELHHETKVTQSHSLIDVEGEKDIECKSHPEEIVRFYCEPCDSCICVVCTFQEHRDHEICSFNEGYVKYKSAMESLVEKCRKRIHSVNERVETINKCENALKKTRENIRDLAISYIQQVRSTERELLKSVDNYLGENVVSFLENRDWLQENADELQTACNLTEIVMRDRGVEMLLLKKEMQSKLNSLLEPSLPTLPKDVITDIQFNPGEVKFGTLSFQDDEEDKINGSINGHIDQKESSLKSKNPSMKTTEMQTDQERTVNTATSMASDMSVSYKDSKNQTRSVRTFTKETETEKIHWSTVTKETETDVIPLPAVPKAKYVETKTRGIMTEKEVLLSHKVQTDSVHTCNRETYTKVESANVAMNTLPVTTVSKGLQVFCDPGTPGSGICVQCCEELTNEKPPSGKPPKIQDIIILNTVDKDGREWRRRRRSLIRSKRVQTDLSMTSPLPESVSLPSLNKVPPERSLSLDSTDYMRPEMHTIALDPIWDDEIPKRAPSYRRRMRDKSTNTSFKLKPVVDTWDVGTYTDSIRTKTFATMTSIDVSTIDTQTCRMNQVDQGIATDFSGQTEKSTSTLAVELMDSETSMPTVCFDDKITWTEPPATAERAMCTDRCENSDMSTETVPVDSCDQGLQVIPLSHDTATEPILMSNKDQTTQVQMVVDDEDSQSSNRKSWHAGTSLFAKLFKSKTSSTSNSEQDLSASSFRPDVKLIDASTETLSVVHCDKETATQRTTQIDQWTLTPSPVMVNTGISPKRPLTMESGVETNQVTFMDQSTYTEVVQYKDSETETVIIVQDNETLTERVKLQDAQTFVQISNETDETNTDPVIVMDANVSTDKDWLDKMKPETSTTSTETVLPDLINSSTNTVPIKNYDISTNISSGELIQCIDRSTGPIPTDTRDRGTMALSFGQTLTQFNDMNTQTSEVRLYDKSVCTSGELEEFESKSIEYSDMATSTESLPYIGLLSELDGDELFLIPESAFDLATNEPILETQEPVEMVDDGTTTDFISANEMSTQTIISSAWQLEDDETETNADLKQKNGKTLYDIGVNTAPKLTFEKGTSTPIRHLFSKGTMTFYIAKTDKATSTFNQTKHIAETCYGSKPQHDKVNKITMTNVDVKDVGTITDSSLIDEKMAACISKLRNVSERLQSPTFKIAPSFPWRSDSPVSSENSSLTNSFSRECELSPRQTLSDDERRKHIMELVAQTETYIKPKDGKSDSASGRKAQPITTLKGKLAPPSTDDEIKSKSLPREYTEQGSESPKNGGRNSPSRLPRYNSAPGRIATVPTQTMKKNMQGSKIPVCQKGQEHNKGVLPAITESRTPSTCSESDSFVSAASDNSSDANLDFSSLKIHVPPSRLSPCSFLSVPEECEPEESATAQLQETPVEAKSPANVGFMKKLFSKNSKKRKNPGGQKQQHHQQQQPHQDKQAKTKQHPKHTAEPPKPKSPKPPKKQPFVYIRQRVFSIQQDNVEELKKPDTETKYVEKPEKSTSNNSERPPSTYDNL